MTNEIVKLIENNIENVNVTLVEVKTKMDNAVEECKDAHGGDYTSSQLASRLLWSLIDEDSYLNSVYDNEEIDDGEASRAFSDEAEETTKIIANKLTDETAKFYFIGRMQEVFDTKEEVLTGSLRKKWIVIEDYVWHVASEINCAVDETDLKKEYKEWAKENHASARFVNEAFLQKKAKETFDTMPSVLEKKLKALCNQAQYID